VRRLVFITQHASPTHPVLAATVPQIAALAERLDEVLVLADSSVPAALPSNCRVASLRAPTQAGRGLRFLRALGAELVGRRPSAIVAHMCPIYAVLAAPLARPLGVPVVLWFTQWHATQKLRLAERMSTAVATVDRESFPFPSAKVRAIGHGIDVASFPCRPPGGDHSELRVLALGRYTRSKGYDVLLDAARRALDDGLALRLRIHGPTLTEPERSHRRELERMVEQLRLDGTVELGPAVSTAEVRSLLAASDVLVSSTRPGAADKVVFEAAAACVPVIASSPALAGVVPERLRFRSGDADELARRLADLVRLGVDERGRIGRTLRETVAAKHSVDTWAEGILKAAGLS
jgi:glycosyltransferase involved in cell wall biosynthesis